MMENFQKLLNSLGYSNESIWWMQAKASTNQNLIVEIDRIGFSETSDDTMQKETTSKYWCCVYDNHGNIVVDASFDDDISDQDAKAIAEAYKKFE